MENQLKRGESLCLSMGGGFFIDSKNKHIYSNELSDSKETFLITVAHIQFLEQRATFSVNEFKKV